MIIIGSERLPVKSWCNDPEEEALQQAKNLANLPFVFKHVALMPDAHTGYGMPIGGVVACEGVISCNMVGVDIGCGLAAVRTNLTELSTERLKNIMRLIRHRVPVGFNKHSSNQEVPELLNQGPFIDMFPSINYPVAGGEVSNALKSLGTLGGGNHFIEIQKGSDGFIWFMVHSGSRNLGKKVADHYNKKAKELNQKWFSQVDPKWDLAFLPVDTQEAQFYIREMNLCLDFAQANRDLMIKRIKQSFVDCDNVCQSCRGKGGKKGKKCPDCSGGLIEGSSFPVEFEQEINIHHNYVTLENHFGNNVWVHRKGATSAKVGELGIIPGSQGTKSYIVEGLGNQESFMSCSHGAGRKMSRTKAKENLDLAAEQKRLDDKGIIHGIRSQKDLDEASGAYKDIDTVMAEQTDLGKILVELQPLGVIKG